MKKDARQPTTIVGVEKGMNVFMPRSILRKAREDAELTQQELADKIGAKREAVSAWERGTQQPTAYYKRRVRVALGNNQDKKLFALDGQESNTNDEEPHDVHEEPTSQPPQVDVTMDSSTTIDIPVVAERSPSSQYGQMAYDSLVVATSKQAIDQNARVVTLTRKADAARVMGDMRSFVESLEQALPLIIDKKRVINAIAVVNHVPEQWQQETAVQNLQDDLNNLHKSLVVVQ